MLVVALCVQALVVAPLVPGHVVELPPGTTIHGTVIDSVSELPLQGAVVVAYSAADPGDLNPPFTYTGEFGHFALTLPAGTYELSVRKERYRTATAQVVVPADLAPVRADFGLEPLSVAVSGTVTNGVTGAPLSNVLVTAMGEYEGWDRTDVEGGFELYLPIGEYELRVSEAGYQSRVIKGVVFNGVNPAECEIELLPIVKAIHGVVTDTSGGPIADANVIARVADQADAPYEWTSTGVDGGYDFYVSAGTYDIEVSKYGYQTVTIPDVVFDGRTAEERNVTLEPAVKAISGVVADATTKAPISGVEVFAWYEDESGGIHDESDTTDVNGAYEFYLPVGTYEMLVNHAGYQLVHLTGVTFDGAATAKRDFALARPAPDTTPPKITVSGVTHGGRYSDAVRPTFSAADPSGVTSLYATLDGHDFDSGDQVSAPGAYTLVVVARDSAGNVGTHAVGFTVTSTTTLSLSAPTVSAYRSARLAGRLFDKAGRTVDNKVIVLEYSYDKVKWTKLATVYTAKKDSKGWFYEYTAKPTKKTYYRARFLGDTVYFASSPVAKTVLPKVSLTRPSFGRTTLAFGRSYTASGYLKPRHASGSYPVKIYAYRYEGGKYVYKKVYRAKASNYSSYTKYTASIKLPSKGKWRLRTVHAADSRNARTYSSYRYVTVVR